MRNSTKYTAGLVCWYWGRSFTDAQLHCRCRTLPEYWPPRRLRSRLSGAHSQGGTLEELNDNLKELVAMALVREVRPELG